MSKLMLLKEKMSKLLNTVNNEVDYDVVRKTAHHGGLHPLLHELLNSGPEGTGGVEQHLVEEARSAADSLALPESSPLYAKPLTSVFSGHRSPPPPSPRHAIPTRPPETGSYKQSGQHINLLSTLVIITTHSLLKHLVHRICRPLRRQPLILATARLTARSVSLMPCFFNPQPEVYSARQRSQTVTNTEANSLRANLNALRQNSDIFPSVTVKLSYHRAKEFVCHVI